MIIKDLLKFAANKYSFPQAHISFGSRVAGKSSLGSDVQISRQCYVHDSAIGNHIRIDEGCNIFESTLHDHVAVSRHSVIANVEMGSFSYVAEGSQLANMTVGKFCSIGPEFVCGHGDHPLDFVSTSPVFYSTRKQCGATFADEDCFQEFSQTTVGNDVWFGARVFVRTGVRIGHGAVIAAGGVVARDIPDYAIVGGVPAKVIRYRFEEAIIERLLQIAWWDWPEADLRKASTRFAQADVNGFLDWASQR